MSAKRRSAQRRDGRGISFGKIEQPVGDRDRVADLAGDPLVDLRDALPVEPGGGGPGAGQPVEHQVVEQLVARERVLGVPVAVGPGPELLDDPGAQGGRRVHQGVADRLRTGRVLARVARVPFRGVLERGERGALAVRSRSSSVCGSGGASGGVRWMPATCAASMLRRCACADARAPVAALRAVALVAELAISVRPGGRDPLDAPAGLRRLVAEAVARQRRADDVEGVAASPPCAGGSVSGPITSRNSTIDPASRV